MPGPHGLDREGETTITIVTARKITLGPGLLNLALAGLPEKPKKG